MNILQIDVEDWYCDVNAKYWPSYESRVVQDTHRIIGILKGMNIQATFFVLGYVAQHHPELVECIKQEGHEVASHGYAHVPITQQTPYEFESDLSKSIEILERITGEKVLGYRAPQFSVTEKVPWAIDIMKKNGLRYDSSVFPCNTPLYGIPAAPRFPYHISSSNLRINDEGERFLEVPLSTYKIPIINRNIPVAGGFYLRFYPYPFMKHALRRIERLGQPAICYLHPWELDPEIPKVASLKWFHYYRLSSTENKFRKLLSDFEFTSTRGLLFD